MSKLMVMAMVMGLASGMSSCATFPILSSSEFTHGVVIAVKGGPRELALAPKSDQIYVSSPGSQMLSIIDINSRQIEETVKLGFRPFAIVFSHDGKYAFVSGEGQGGVVKVDTGLKMVVGEIPMEKDFFSVGAVISLDSKRLYISNINGIFLTIIDTMDFQIIKKIPLKEGGGFGLAISPDGSWLYVTHAFNRSISVIDTKDYSVNVIKPVGKIPVAVAISPNGKTAYVADNAEPSITVIDTMTGKAVDKIITGASVFHKMGRPKSFSPLASMYFNEDFEELMVWNKYLHYVAVVDLAKRVTKSAIPVKKRTRGMALDSSGQLLILSNYKDNTVTIRYRETPP